MSYTPKLLRRILKSMIRKLGESRDEFVKRPGRDFTRPRTLTFETVILQSIFFSYDHTGPSWPPWSCGDNGKVRGP